MFLYDLPEKSPRFVEIRGDLRMRCECCELPTVALAADRFLEVDWQGTMLGCTLCGWENGAADETGKPLAGESPEDRNDGVSLNEAQQNFGRYAWMHDPDYPPAWLGVSTAWIG